MGWDKPRVIVGARSHPHQIALPDLRRAARQAQERLAATPGLGQDTIARLGRRGDMPGTGTTQPNPRRRAGER